MKTLNTLIVITLLLGVALAAQAQDGSSIKVSPFDSDRPTTTVLRVLFDSVGAKYTLGLGVTGVMDIHNISTKQPFDVTLKALLDSNSPPLMYDVTDGVYHIKVRPIQTPPQTVRGYKIPITNYDPCVIAQYVAQLGAKGVVVVVPPNGQ